MSGPHDRVAKTARQAAERGEQTKPKHSKASADRDHNANAREIQCSVAFIHSFDRCLEHRIVVAQRRWVRATSCDSTSRIRLRPLDHRVGANCPSSNQKSSLSSVPPISRPEVLFVPVCPVDPSYPKRERIKRVEDFALLSLVSLSPTTSVSSPPLV